MVKPYEDIERDFTSHVVFETSKALVHIRQTRPYGFWRVSSDLPGPMPDKYSGQYTELNVAIVAAQNYIRDKKLKILQGPVPYTKALDE